MLRGNLMKKSLLWSGQASHREGLQENHYHRNVHPIPARQNGFAGPNHEKINARDQNFASDVSHVFGVSLRAVSLGTEFSADFSEYLSSNIGAPVIPSCANFNTYVTVDFLKISLKNCAV